MNILTGDIEEIAERVKLSAIASRLVVCFVALNGSVRVVKPAHRRSVPFGDDCLVGTYSSAASVSDIEDDLVCRMRELTPRKAA